MSSSKIGRVLLLLLSGVTKYAREDTDLVLYLGGIGFGSLTIDQALWN